MAASKHLFIVGLILLFTACSSERAGLQELQRLCEKDAGLTIYKTVEADGYYDASRKGGVLRILIPSKYNFVEFCNHDVDRPSFDEPGCWRLTKVSREAGQCNEIVDGALQSSGGYSYPEFREKHCIAVEKIEQPEAEYTYLVERKEWWVDEGADAKMTQYTGKVINKTEEIYGQGVDYVLTPKRSNPPSFNCGSAQITGLEKSIPFAVGLIEKTLVPKEEKKTGETK